MNRRFQLGLGILAITTNVVMASPFSYSPSDSLALIAERYTENELHLVAGSVHAVAINRRVTIGECASGFEFKYPFGTKTTLEIVCPDSSVNHRYVTMTLPIGESNQSVALLSEPKPSPSVNIPSVWVASHDLPYGKVLSADDLVLSSDHPKKSQGISSLADLIGTTLTRPLTTGSLVARADIRPTQLVKRQMPVLAYSEFAGGQVTSKMVALQAGAAGDYIELENPQSGRKRYGQIQSDGTVRLGGPESQKNLLAGAKVAP
jgi:flagella basal body P-ring formation protein FlgA